MTQLHEEHRNIAKLLKALEYQLRIFESGAQPDYDVLSAIADYFLGFPETCHHPKEDRIYERMRERNAELAEKVASLGKAHENISGLAQRFHDAVENVVQEVEVPRTAFSDVARHFLEDQRHHMQMEEEYFFPLAMQTLTPGDWKDIDEEFAEKTDPVFGDETAREYAALRDDALRWEQEDEAEEEKSR